MSKFKDYKEFKEGTESLLGHETGDERGGTLWSIIAKKTGRTDSGKAQGRVTFGSVLSQRDLWSSIPIDILISRVLFFLLLVVHSARIIARGSKRNGRDPKV